MKMYDISVPISGDLPVYPGDPPVMVERALNVKKGDGANVSRLALCTHSGTHIDAPRHMDDRAVSVDHLSLSLLIGRVLVVEIGGTKKVGRKELERLPVKGEERLLLKTENSLLWSHPGFTEDYASLTEDGADYLIGIGIRLIGIDYLSIEAFDGNGVIHRKLLEHGVIILEGLNLGEVPKGVYELVCLPLKIRDGDGAPARVILRQREENIHHAEFDIHTTKWPLA
jgi:arylformamidase